MKTNRRGGFTLVEMIVVIAIIGILAALLIPAIASAQRSAKLAVARAEITGIESGIAAFQSKYGAAPPSGITLYEDPTKWTADPASTAKIRQFWPQYDFGTPNDINGNGVTTDIIILDGAECLVFFLGGMNVSSTANGATIYKKVGFATNATNPFLAFAASSNRVGPFFEFDSGRFQDIDVDGMLEYRDKLGDVNSDPILYYSMYEGAGFVQNDQYVSTKCGAMLPYLSQPQAAPGSPLLYWKQQSYQLIAPGWDGILGNGGFYDQKNAATSLAVGRPTATSNLNAKGKAEFDNLTNFFGGRLGDGQ